MKDKVLYFLKMIQVGCIGFGGGSSLIPVFEKFFVTDSEIESKQEFDRDIIVASITPGALPVEIASSIGKKVAGNMGMILSAVCLALPGTLASIFFFSLFQAYQDSLFGFIAVFSILSSAFIICLLMKYIKNTIYTNQKQGKKKILKTYIVIIGVFLLIAESNIYKLFEIDRTAIFSISTFHVLVCAFFFIFYSRSNYSPKHMVIATVLVIVYLLGHGKRSIITNPYIMQADHICMLILAIYGFLQSLRKRNAKITIEKKELIKTVTIWILFMVFLCLPALILHFGTIDFMGKGMLSSLMSFGGGDAYLTVADGLFVENAMVPEDIFYGQIVTVVNVLPGSILCKVLTMIGFYYGVAGFHSQSYGLLLALAGFALSIGMSCMVYQLIHYLYDSICEVAVVKTISRWIRPIMGGLLCNVILSLVIQVKRAGKLLGLSPGISIVILLVCIVFFELIQIKKK